MENEAEQRKKRSIAILTKEGVPYLEMLRGVEFDSQLPPRTTEEVALRAIALTVVAVKGESLDQDLTRDLIKRFDIYDSFTPDERRFIDDLSPSEHDRVQFSWRYESLNVMLWALSFIKQLGRPDRIVDAGHVVSFPADLGRKRFLKKAKLRAMSEILDETDLIYRYHWATTEARIKGTPPPAGLEPGVVYERHYSLNWLVRYFDQEWDKVSTDT